MQINYQYMYIYVMSISCDTIKICKIRWYKLTSISIKLELPVSYHLGPALRKTSFLSFSDQLNFTSHTK
jgi:hypothetical protein